MKLPYRYRGLAMMIALLILLPPRRGVTPYAIPSARLRSV